MQSQRRDWNTRCAEQVVLLIDMLIADCFVPLLPEPALADRYQLIRYHKRVGWAAHLAPPVSIGDTPPTPRRCSSTSVCGALIAGHSTGASIGAQLALDYPEKVHTLTLLEPTLLSLPLGGAFLAAGPVFEAYGSGDHSGAFAMFVPPQAASIGRSVERCSRSGSRVWYAVDQGCRHLLRSRAARPHRVDVRAGAGRRHSQTRSYP